MKSTAPKIKTIIWIFLFLLIIILRCLLLEVYLIPSGSMENTLLVQDRVLSLKIKHQANGTFFPSKHLDFNQNNSVTEKRDKRFRLGLKLKRGDVIIFSMSGSQPPFYIKRCIGMPGEVLEIRNDVVFVNNKQIDFPPQTKLRYSAWGNNTHKLNNLITKHNINVLNCFSDTTNCYCELELTPNQYAVIKNADCIDSISHFINPTDTLIHTYPYNNQFHWTIHGFGSVLIPQKGMEIVLNRQNFVLYEKVLRKYEKQNFYFENDHTFKDGEIINNYIFKQDYFFVMGDNRHISTDSRSWGFIPENYIRGKAILILYSYNNRQFHWNRFLKEIE